MDDNLLAMVWRGHRSRAKEAVRGAGQPAASHVGRPESGEAEAGAAMYQGRDAVVHPAADDRSDGRTGEGRVPSVRATERAACGRLTV